MLEQHYRRRGIALACCWTLTVFGCHGGRSSTASASRTSQPIVSAPGSVVAPTTSPLAANPSTAELALPVASSAGAADDGSYALPADRRTVWTPGVRLKGGIPARPEVCAKLDAPAEGSGGRDATARIQAAIRSCPAGKTVALGAGTFLVNDDIVYLDRGITLRGAGAGKTILRRSNGAVDKADKVGVAKPVIIVGASRWTHDERSTELATDAAKGASSVVVANAAGIKPGSLVLVDEVSGAGWLPDPQGRGRKVWASPDFRVVWTMHLPWVQYIDDAGGSDASGPFDLKDGKIQRPPASMGWFSRVDRPTCEIHEVAKVSGNTLFFTTPLHIDYRKSHQAQVAYFDYATVRGAGIEAMTVSGGDDGNVRFVNAADSWAKNVEVTTWRGEGFAIHASHAIEVRDSYVHDAALSVPGGGAYAISLQGGSADCLIENNVVLRVNKVIVSRSSGAGSVVAYNYMDQGVIDYAPAWQEMGVGGSHMVGPHHMLFEGNWSFNGDNDHTHGSSIYHTYFRNYLSGYRSRFTTNTGISIDDVKDVPGRNGPRRCAGASAFSYWMSFVGNVLGTPEHTSGWQYESSNATNAIWAIGWENHGDLFDADPKVGPTLLRDGNYDFLTKSVHWHGIGSAGSTPKKLPDSLYLASKPAFFGKQPWPWVEPSKGAIHTLPAKARYDAGTPNVVVSE